MAKAAALATYNRHFFGGGYAFQCQEEVAGRLRQLGNDDIRRSE